MPRTIFLWGALASFTTSVALAAESRSARQLNPSSQWVLDYADERCSLRRNFGSGDDVVLLQIDSFGSWNSFHVTISGMAVPRSNKPTGHGSYRFTDDRDSRDAMLMLGTVGQLKNPAVSLNIRFAAGSDSDPERWARMTPDEQGRFAALIERAQPDFDRTVESMRLTFDRGSPIDLHIGNMAEPLAAMRECVDDLYKTWGMDADGQRSLSRAAVPLPFTVKHVQQHYPDKMLLSGISAYVPVRLMVDASGVATSCVVQSTAVDAAFKTAVCANLQGKFNPALDAEGRPVPSMYHTSVNYLI